MSSADDAAVEPMVRQGELVTEIARAVVGEVDGPWTSIRYEVESLAPYMEHGTFVTRPGGEVEQRFPPDDAVDLTEELRQVMYQPGAGTWFSAVLVVNEDGSADTNFNYDDEPAWPDPVQPVWYVQDLRKFPRDPDAIPDWLRNRLTEGAVQERELDEDTDEDTDEDEQ
jgi:hypothetical protein